MQKNPKKQKQKQQQQQQKKTRMAIAKLFAFHANAKIKQWHAAGA